MDSALPLRLVRACLTVALAVAAMVSVGGTTVAQGGVVRVLLFHSPSCIHCETVRTEVLPPLQAQYAEQLEIVEVDASRTEGYRLFQAAMDELDVPTEEQAFPALVIGNHVLIGSIDISARLPDLIASYASQGGVDLPATPSPADGLPDQAAQPQTWRERFMRDPQGNGLSVAVLLLLLASLAAAARPWAWQRRLARCLPWALPAVALAGLGVACYLASVEMAQAEAYCGPVGDCNAVQQSDYALLFGVLPVGVLGVLGYLAILGAWAMGRLGRGHLARLARAATLLLAGFGVLFSAYLTFLEPFVIGATCAWCLSSALCMALILLLSAGPGWDALGMARTASEAVAT
jgi:uncharacterized membrane protein